ncbi:CLUMA_CG017116, isoform A [Clunio marinus]|uniref:CLUMA_CG017116, isoform A n=1 Tax=Clunio marinus TaxID=568069 RepID=A0A1J1IXW9_9DIPT|nr:CLUMA_CG017116, isoform A [Clunio marinus]
MQSDLNEKEIAEKENEKKTAAKAEVSQLGKFYEATISMSVENLNVSLEIQKNFSYSSLSTIWNLLKRDEELKYHKILRKWKMRNRKGEGNLKYFKAHSNIYVSTINQSSQKC